MSAEFPFPKTCIGCPMSAYRAVPTPCRRDSSPCGRGLRVLLALPLLLRAYCPDDPSGNSAPPNLFRHSFLRSVLRRTTRSRMSLLLRSPSNIPKNPHNDNRSFRNRRHSSSCRRPNTNSGAKSHPSPSYPVYTPVS